MKAQAKTNELFRAIPKVDLVLEHQQIKSLGEKYPHSLVVAAVRRALDKIRDAIRSGDLVESLGKEGIGVESVAKLATATLEQMLTPSLSPVINATGVVLHTNLGRAPLAPHALQQLQYVSQSYSNLEYDVEARGRGSRHTHVQEILCQLLDVESALVVNNCAAAVMLVLSGLAHGGEVVVSRGELVEIGGSFRVPDIMEVSGATLREVGTTNRTRLADYEAAINEKTRLLMKAYRSNFALVGFTEEVSSEELAQLAREHQVASALDLGSGLLVDLSEYGVRNALTVQQTVKTGLDVVCFSGDKLLGGPQAGIIVGKEDVLSRLRKHPLTRALRVDKLTISALEATLSCYLDGSWRERIPTLEMLTASPQSLRERADAIVTHVSAKRNQDTSLAVEAAPVIGRVGGGTLPLAELESWAVRVQSSTQSAERLERFLRQAPTPIICRMEDNALLLDVRTLRPSEIDEISHRLAELPG